MSEKRKIPAFEFIMVTAMTIAWICLQIIVILKTDVTVLEQSDYIVGSFVTEGFSIPYSNDFIAWAYMNVLRTVFYMVGNYAVAALWLQFTLQFVGSFFLYRGFRKVVGRVLSVFVYAIALFVPYYLFGVDQIRPMWLPFFVVACVIWIFLSGVAFVIHKIKKGRIQKEEEEEKLMEPQNIFDSNMQLQQGEMTGKVKLLDNPLPGPKKHVSKVLDYDLNLDSLPRAFQRYDITVADDDDYDIK